MAKSYAERARISQNPLTKRILEIIEKKKSNLCVSVDLIKKQEFLELIDKVGPYVCCIKVNSMQT